MEQPINEFEKFISECTDNDLPSLSFFDAAIRWPNIDEFNILADMIVEELVKRGLTAERVFQTRDMIVKDLKSRKNPVEWLRQCRGLLSAVHIGWSSEKFETIELVSRVYNAAYIEDLPEKFQERAEVEENHAPVIPLPEEYSWSSKGELLEVTPQGNTFVIYPKPIYIKNIMVNIHSGCEQLRIAFQTDEREKTHILPPQEAYNGTALTKLSSYGAVINKEVSRDLSRFFFRCMSDVRPTIEKKYVTDRIGWLDDSYDEFIPYTNTSKVIYDTAAKYQKEYSQLLKTRGTLDGWTGLVRKYCNADHIPFRIMLASSFASVLVKKLSPEPFFVHLSGKTGTGKSVALRVIASVWAKPDEYIIKMEGTLDGLEKQAQFYGNLPYCLDDSMNYTNSGGDLTDVVYRLAAGKPKVRGLGSGGMQEQNEWCNVIITNGEHRMFPLNTGGGADHRVIEVESEENIFGLSKEGFTVFCHELEKQYNTAGREFIKCLLEEGAWDEAEKLYKDFEAEIQHHAAGRQTGAAAIILTADTLMSRWIFKDEIRLTVEDLLPYLKTEENIDPDAPVHQRLYEWISAHPAYFEKKNTGTRYGQRVYNRSLKKKVIAFIPYMLEQLIPRLGGQMDSYIMWLKKQKRLVISNGEADKLIVEMENFTDSQGSFQTKKTLRCYGILFDEENQPTEAPTGEAEPEEHGTMAPL